MKPRNEPLLLPGDAIQIRNDKEGWRHNLDVAEQDIPAIAEMIENCDEEEGPYLFRVREGYTLEQVERVLDRLIDGGTIGL